MSTSRRQFIRQLLSAGLLSQFDLDIDKLLWIPGAKKIFIPSQVDSEMITSIKYMFESDDWFYDAINRRGVEVISSREFRIPLQLKPRNENG